MRHPFSRLPRPRSRSFGVTAVSAVALCAAIAGCQPDRGPGTVIVSYVLGNSKTCAEVGVTDVRAAVFRGDYDEPVTLYSDAVPCEDGEIVLDAVDPANYEIRVIGYDDNGVAIFDNLGQPEDERKLEVFESAETEIEAELTARPAELLVRWRLGEGGFDNCVGVGIDRFEVKAYQVDGGTLLLDTELDCELGGGTGGFRTVEDPTRALNGVLFGEVGIQAVAADGTNLGTPAVFVFDPVGPGYAVELTIECTDAGCTPA